MPHTHTAAAVECQQTEKIESIDRELGRLCKVVLYGNGQPSLVTQMAIATKTITALVWVAAVTLASVIGQMVILWFRMIGKL